MHTPGRFVARSVAVLMLGITVTAGCEVRDPSERRRERAAAPADAPYEAAVEEGLGAAVAIIVDTSGSMKDAAPGDGRPKFANRAAVDRADAGRDRCVHRQTA